MPRIWARSWLAGARIVYGTVVQLLPSTMARFDALVQVQSARQAGASGVARLSSDRASAAPPPAGPSHASPARTYPSGPAGMRRRPTALSASSALTGPRWISPHDGWKAPTSSMTRSNGPSRSRIVAYSVVRPVSPLKNTECRGERMTIDDHSVALRSWSPRPEKCCDGPAVTDEFAVRRAVRLPPIKLDDALGSARPKPRDGLRPRARSRTARRASPARGSSDSRGGRSGHATRSRRRWAAARATRRAPAGTACGPTNRDGEARGPHTGSVSTRQPSISISTVECPSQVARSPLRGSLPRARADHGRAAAHLETRRSPPHRNSDNDKGAALASRNPGSTG